MCRIGDNGGLFDYRRAVYRYRPRRSLASTIGDCVGDRWLLSSRSAIDCETLIKGCTVAESNRLPSYYVLLRLVRRSIFDCIHTHESDSEESTHFHSWYLFIIRTEKRNESNKRSIIILTLRNCLFTFLVRREYNNEFSFKSISKYILSSLKNNLLKIVVTRVVEAIHFFNIRLNFFTQIKEKPRYYLVSYDISFVRNAIHCIIRFIYMISKSYIEILRKKFI